MSPKAIILNEALKVGGKVIRSARDARLASKPVKLKSLAKSAILSGPIKDVALICGRAGVAGAVVDGSMGAVAAFKAVRDGKLDNAGAAKHVVSEAGCGFVTSSSGTAGTVAAFMLTGSMGPAALVAGMGASMGSRYVYRRIVGETLPGAAPDSKRDDEEAANLEEIGPKPSE